MGQYITVEYPDCGRIKDTWIDGREIRAGTRCGGCGDAWEFDLAKVR